MVPLRPLAALGALTQRIRSMRFWRLSWALRAYITAVTAGAAATIGFVAAGTHWTLRDALLFTGFLACSGISIEAMRTVNESTGRLRRDMMNVWYLAIAVNLPPIYALVAAAPVGVLKQLRTQPSYIHRRVFTAAAIGLSYGLVTLMYHYLARHLTSYHPADGTRALVWAGLVTACGTAGLQVNNLLVVFAVQLDDGSASASQQLVSMSALSEDMVEVGTGVLIALAVSMQPLLMVLAMPSVLLHRRFFLHAQLVAQAQTDARTGLLNAAAWQRNADEKLAESIRTSTPVAVVMLDIDRFKMVNDTYGHQAGDTVLAMLSGTLRAQMREYDLVGRYGGEEFVIFLPRTSKDDAITIAERIRRELAGIITFATGNGSTGKIQLRITVSVGVVTVEEKKLASCKPSLEKLISSADAALYRAKANGRDQVNLVVYDVANGELFTDYAPRTRVDRDPSRMTTKNPR